jgi:tRNA (guanine-N7-)-methyltransferase
LIYSLPSILEPLNVATVFGNVHPVEVELGSGDGTFIAKWASQNPGRNFLAVERLLGRLRKIDRKSRRLSLENLRAIRIEAGYFIEYLMPPRSIAALHIYFPDPWPKRRHWRRRLVNPRFAELAARALITDGAVYLRTDDRAYFAQMQSVFSGNANFMETQTPPELAGVLTDFESDFIARGVETLRAAYRKHQG